MKKRPLNEGFFFAKTMYTLYHNARISALNPKYETFSAMVTQGDKIIYTGNPDGINLPAHQLKKVDLHERTVVPGFIDCHTHIASVALYSERLDLKDCLTLPDAMERIKTHLATFTEEHWVLGGGWNANIWPEGRPHKKDLDILTEDRPIALYNKDGHTMWMNSKALQSVGFDQNTSDPTGGKLGRDPGGELNGLIYETACFIVERKAGVVPYTFLNRCMNKLYPQLFRLGITSVHSCESLEFYQTFKQMAANKELGIRICMHPPMADIERLIDEQIRSGLGDEWLRMGGLKYFVDGSLGSQTAEMFLPYEQLGHTGISVMEEQELGDRLQYGARHGLSATVHAIGDKANHKTLNAISRAKQVAGSADLRHRIEHAQILRPDDRLRYRDLNIIASMQPLHIADDVQIAEKYLGERTSDTYPINALMHDGVRVVFGSDMPVADPDPLKGILAAVARRYQLDRSQPVWHPEHCITPLQALTAYTREAAFASYEENLKGTLEVGKLADFVVLSDDIVGATEASLCQTNVVMTVLGGEVVYQSED